MCNVLFEKKSVICVVQYVLLPLRSKAGGRVNVTGLHRGSGAVLTQRQQCLAVHARINSTDGRSAGRCTHSLRRAVPRAAPAGSMLDRQSARRWPLHFPTRFLPPPTSNIVLRGRQRGPQGQAARALSAPAPVAGSATGHGPAACCLCCAKTTVRARAAGCRPCHAPPTHSFIRCRCTRAWAGPSARRTSASAELRVWQVASAGFNFVARSLALLRALALAASGRARAQCRSRWWRGQRARTCGGYKHDCRITSSCSRVYRSS